MPQSFLVLALPFEEYFLTQVLGIISHPLLPLEVLLIIEKNKLTQINKEMKF